MPVLSHQTLLRIYGGVSPLITADTALCDDQIQMASIDLSLKGPVYGMRASGLPRRGETVRSRIDASAKTGYTFNLTGEDKLLSRRQTYIIPLNEGLKLPPGFAARFSPKSSTGRVDVLARILADGIPHFDSVPAEGYRGPLYLEVTPLSCDILLRSGQSLMQMRLRQGDSLVSANDLVTLQAEKGIVWGKDGKPIAPEKLSLAEHGLYMHVDLDRDIVGFMARDPILAELSFAKSDFYDPYDFWEPITRPKGGSIVLNPGRFYLLATKERVKVPSNICGDIAAYDASTGEFRTHYAGFFDPGFGGSKPEERGTVGVMEVRGREIPFELQDNQPVCRMDFQWLDEVPNRLYGAGNNYTGEQPSLGKFFRNRQEIWQD